MREVKPPPLLETFKIVWSCCVFWNFSQLFWRRDIGMRWQSQAACLPMHILLNFPWRRVFFWYFLSLSSLLVEIFSSSSSCLHLLCRTIGVWLERKLFSFCEYLKIDQRAISSSFTERKRDFSSTANSYKFDWFYQQTLFATIESVSPTWQQSWKGNQEEIKIVNLIEKTDVFANLWT